MTTKTTKAALIILISIGLCTGAPSDSLVNHGWCLAQPGNEYVVYQQQAQPFTLEIAGAGSTLSGEWFNAFTGQRTAAGVFENGTAKLTPPNEWSDAPLVGAYSRYCRC